MWFMYVCLSCLEVGYVIDMLVLFFLRLFFRIVLLYEIISCNLFVFFFVEIFCMRVCGYFLFFIFFVDMN